MTLVELLVTMGIAVVLTGMILVTWFALQTSFANQAKANEARDFSRDSMARMVREIRDGTMSQQVGGNGIVDASANQLTIYTTFNDAGASDAGYGNLLITRFVYDPSTGELVRMRYGSGGLSSAPKTIVLAEHVVNTDSQPVFTYWYYTTNGLPAHTTAPGSTQLGGIYAVGMDVLIDQNPGQPPAAIQLQSTAEIRNVRQ